MFTTNSRYYNLASNTFAESTGKTIVYKQRRFLPQAETLDELTEVTIKEGDRFDTITANILGNPLDFWKIADANNTMNPHVLIQEIGRTLTVGVPSLTGNDL